MKSSVDLPNEVEDKPPSARCKLENSKEKNMMQRDAHSSYFGTPLHDDEDEILRNEMIYGFCNHQMTFQPLDILSTSHHGSDFAENSKVDLYVENEFCIMDPCHKKNGLICQLLE